MGSLSPCYCVFVGLVAPSNCAEEVFRYLTTNVHFYSLKSGNYAINQLIGLLKEVNEYLCYCPCTKHMLGSLDALVNRATPISELDLCVLIMHAVPPNVDAKFKASLHRDEFVTDMDTLLKRLETICEEIKCNSHTLSNFSDSHGLRPKKGAGWNVSKEGQ